MNDYALSPLESVNSEDYSPIYGGDYSTDRSISAEKEAEYCPGSYEDNFYFKQQDEEESRCSPCYPFYDDCSNDMFENCNAECQSESDDDDNKVVDTSYIKIKYKKKLCCMCYKNVLRNDMFILDKSNNGNDNYICVNCSIKVNDIKRLSDWEEQVIGDGIICYRCKRKKSSYRFKKNKNLCSYCSYKQKWRNMKKN